MGLATKNTHRHGLKSSATDPLVEATTLKHVCSGGCQGFENVGLTVPGFGMWLWGLNS